MSRVMYLTLVLGGMSATLSWGAPPSPTPIGKETGLIPRTILFGNPDKASPELSPDGKQLAFLAPVDGVLNVWVGPVDDPSAAKPVTKDTSRGIRRFEWLYTNQHILYAQDVGGDENFHIYVTHLPTLTTKDLTPYAGARGEIQQVSPKFPNEVLLSVNNRNKQFFDIQRVNVDTGEHTVIQQNDRFADFITDDDYQVRLASAYAPDGSVVAYLPKGDDWEEYERIPSEDTLTTNFLAFTKGGDQVYMVDSRERDTAALYLLDLNSKKKELLAEDPRADAGTLLMHPEDHTAQGVSFNYTRREWKFFDPAVAKDFQLLDKVADGEINIVSRSYDDRRWIIAFLLDDGPVRYYRYDRDTQKATFLFTNNSKLDGWDLQPMHDLVIKSRDGLGLVCYLTLPPGSDANNDARPDQPQPMVLFVHGGPWARDDWGYNPYHQFLANRGYAVLSVNFRGSTGFGKKFLNAGNREWAGKMHDDLIDAVDWALKEKIALPDKVAIMGGSYGGYATLVGLTFTPEKFACGVDIVGPSNILTLLSTIPPYWAPAVQMFKDRVGDFTSEAGKVFLEERSPLSRVDAIQKPLLIGQGANDPRVKQSESDQIVHAMKEKKIPVTYVLFPDEGHGFARPENRLAFNAVTEAFLAKELGGRYQAIGEDFEGSTIKVPAGANDVPGLPEAQKQ